LPLPPFIVATVMIVPISRPAANATNHPNRCYRFLEELPTVGGIRPPKNLGDCRDYGETV
jgi:hypothetical protein